MNLICKICAFLVTLLLCVGAATGDPSPESEKSPIPAAISAIDKSLSSADRRAILAQEIRGRGDRLRADLMSPLEGEVERIKLIEWIEREWQLSDDTEFSRYFSKRGMKESREIALFLIYAWIANYEQAGLSEKELFREHFRRQKSLEAFTRLLKESIKRRKDQQGAAGVFDKPPN